MLSLIFHLIFHNGVLPPFADESPRAPIPNLEIDEQDVLNLLLHVDVKKSPGPDGIPNELLYRYAGWVSKYMTKIFQTPISSGCFPGASKRAKVPPVPKSVKKWSVNDYRLIYLTSTTSKLLEQIIYKHPLHYLDQHNLLYCRQHGFRKGLSTVTHFIETVRDLAETRNSCGQKDIIYLDYANAFDKVCCTRNCYLS